MHALIALPLDGGGELPQFDAAKVPTLRARVVTALRRLFGRRRRRVRHTMYLLG
jgi:hypothetical protein